MNYIKSYKLFLEEAEFDVLSSDSADVKVAKEKMQTMKTYITDYKNKKPLIDKIYTEIKDPKKIEDELKKVLGQTDVMNGKDRNPFLVEYTHVAKLNADVTQMGKDNLNDKIKLDDFQQELRYAKEQTIKDVVNKKIADVNKRMLDRTKNIQTLSNQYRQSLKEHTDKMGKIEKEMSDNIKKISNVNQK